MDEYVTLHDKDSSILNLTFLRKSFVRVGNNQDSTFFIEYVENGGTHKVYLNYTDRDLMLKDKELFLKKLCVEGGYLNG